MNKLNISAIDLNLLVFFDAVMARKNTVHAAELLGVSQPAVSHALNRLRDIVGDPLFVRASKGLIPTPRAHELAAPVREILEQVEATLLGSPTFNPATVKRTFRIATTDYFEQVALPHILKAISESAPEITIISTQTQGSLPADALSSGTDLAIAGFYEDVPERFFQQKLFSDDFVCVERRTKALKLTLEQYATRKHLVVSPQGDLKTRAREVMKKKGFELRYVAGVSSFAATGAVVVNSNLLLTCPRRLAKSFQEHLPVSVHELPFSISGIQVSQVWHDRLSNDLGHKWLRGLIRDICGRL